jgi:putative transposase
MAGGKCGMLCVIAEFTREALAIHVERRLGAMNVLEILAGPIVVRVAPPRGRSDAPTFDPDRPAGSGQW